MVHDERKTHGGWLNRTVLGVGITSALGDIAHESATVVLPGFMAVLGIPAAALGAIEGFADAVSSFTKLGAGYLSDRLGHRKPIVVLGYALTAVAQGLFALASGWGFILLGRTLAWLGRGIRGPIRDAILAESITKEAQGRAFGFHRAADTLGSVIGPLLGVGFLTLFQGMSFHDSAAPFRLVFWITLIPGFLSVLSFGFLVKDGDRAPNSRLRFWATVRDLPTGFRRYLIAVGIFGVGDFAHTLLILAATQILTPRMGVVRAAQFAAMLYVLRNVVYTAASFPIGALADRIGHRRILVVGYLVGAIMAGGLAAAFFFHSQSLLLLVAVFVLAGFYIAVQDTLEATLTSILTEEHLRGTAYGALGTVNGVGDFFSSTMVGAMWTLVGPEFGFGIAALLMAAGTFFMARRVRGE